MDVLNPILNKITIPVQAIKSLRFALLRLHFQMHFRQWNCFNFDQNFTSVSKGPMGDNSTLV